MAAQNSAQPSFPPPPHQSSLSSLMCLIYSVQYKYACIVYTVHMYAEYFCEGVCKLEDYWQQLIMCEKKIGILLAWLILVSVKLM